MLSRLTIGLDFSYSITSLDVSSITLLLPYCSFERHTEQLLGLDGKLHGQLVEHLLGVAVDDESHGILGGNATLVAIEELVF
jgi:hypothetical protein